MIARLWRRLRQLRLRTVVLVTAIPGLLLPFFFFRSLTEFSAIAAGFPSDVQRVVENEDGVWKLWLDKVTHVRRLIKVSRVAERVPTERLWANDEIHLHVPGTSWDALLEDLPMSGESYQPIRILNRERWRKAKLRIRGNSGFHWLFEKRSLKIKTSKKNLMRGYRRMNLTVKFPYVESLAHGVALDWGLLAPESSPVLVFVDGKLYGTMRFLEEVDESFLRRHGRMPGDIFKGEGSPFTNEWHWGLPVGFLLRDPWVWPKSARDNTLDESDRDEMVEMARALGTPGREGLLQLNRLFNRDVVVRNVAYHLFLNEHHAVDGNNLKFYVDPLDGKIEPIVWDPYMGSNEVIFSGDPPPGYPVVNSVFHKMAGDPRLMNEVFRFFYDRLNNLNGLQQRVDDLRRHLTANQTSFSVERENPWFPIRGWFFEANVKVLMGNRQRILEGIEDVRLQMMNSGSDLVLGCQGLAGVDVTALKLIQNPDRGPILTRNLDGDSSADGIMPMVRGSVQTRDDGTWFVPDPPLRILPAYTGINRVVTVPLPYPFSLGSDVVVTAVEAHNAITGTPVETVTATTWPAVQDEVTHPWRLPQIPEPATRTLAPPVVRLTSELVVGEHETLVIQPGTRVLLAPGVNVRVLGRILAEGTPEKPIVFEALENGRPWGCLALQGDSASGSIFSHVKFSGGSLARFGALRYPGMVNVHRAKNVIFSSCEFSHNAVGDDALRGADAGLEIRDCWFHNINADAIDMDYSSGTISGCTFERMGNDAIDLMNSSPLIAGNTMVESGDKGISIGERSNPFIVDNRITRCAVGIQIKDDSDPLVLNCEITSCGTGVEAYQKNWRYGIGGQGRVVNSVVAENGIDLIVREQSSLSVRSSVVSHLPEENSRLRFDAVVSPEGPRPLPELTSWSLLTGGPDEPGIGPTGSGRKVTRRELVVDDVFQDGFRLKTRGWALVGSTKLYVEGHELRATLRNRAVVLEKDFGLTDLPAGARLHLRVAATRSAEVILAVAIGGRELTRTLDLDSSEQSVVVDLPAGDLDRVRFRSEDRTTLRLRRAAVSVP